jgi:hypothetical protein
MRYNFPRTPKVAYCGILILWYRPFAFKPMRLKNMYKNGGRYWPAKGYTQNETLTVKLLVTSLIYAFRHFLSKFITANHDSTSWSNLETPGCPAFEQTIHPLLFEYRPEELHHLLLFW